MVIVRGGKSFLGGENDWKLSQVTGWFLPLETPTHAFEPALL